MDYQPLIDDLRDLATRYAKDSAMTALCSESAAALAALRAEVERLREALQSICQRYCYAYQNLAWTEMGSEYYSAYCIAAQALQLTQPLPAPPDAG